MNTVFYIIVGNWYVWILRPRPNDYMLYGVWKSYTNKAHRVNNKKAKHVPGTSQSV